jgi:hypothetical protein
LSNSSWIREICKISNDINVPEKNATKSTKTKVSLEMAEKGAVKGPGSQIIKMTLRRGKEGAEAEHVKHNRKTSLKFKQLPRVSEEEESPS